MVELSTADRIALSLDTSENVPELEMPNSDMTNIAPHIMSAAISSTSKIVAEQAPITVVKETPKAEVVVPIPEIFVDINDIPVDKVQALLKRGVSMEMIRTLDNKTIDAIFHAEKAVYTKKWKNGGDKSIAKAKALKDSVTIQHAQMATPVHAVSKVEQSIPNEVKNTMTKQTEMIAAIAARVVAEMTKNASQDTPNFSGVALMSEAPAFVLPTIVAPAAPKPVFVRQYEFKKGNKVVKTAACSITGFTPNENNYYQYIPGVESPSEVHIHANNIRTLGAAEVARRYLELDAILTKNNL